MLVQRIQQRLFAAADQQLRAAEAMPAALEATAVALVGGLTAGGRVWVAGLGLARPLAEHAQALLAGRFERERPGLAVLVLPAALAGSSAPAQALARCIETVAQPGDQLWLLAAEAAERDTACAAIAAAHGREAGVLAWVPAQAGWAEALEEHDVLLATDTAVPAQALPLLLAGLHAVCDAVDVQLLGEPPADEETPR